MINENFKINIYEKDGMRLWEMDDIPAPNGIEEDTAFYCGQKNVEQLLKTVHRKAYINKEEACLDALFAICERSLEQGVVDDGTISWKDDVQYTRISWTSYFWKLPPALKRRSVDIIINKQGRPEMQGSMTVSLKKIADDDGDIHLPPKIRSKLNLRNGDTVTVRIKFSVGK